MTQIEQIYGSVPTAKVSARTFPLIPVLCPWRHKAIHESELNSLPGSSLTFLEMFTSFFFFFESLVYTVFGKDKRNLEIVLLFLIKYNSLDIKILS